MSRLQGCSKYKLGILFVVILSLAIGLGFLYLNTQSQNSWPKELTYNGKPISAACVVAIMSEGSEHLEPQHIDCAKSVAEWYKDECNIEEKYSQVIYKTLLKIPYNTAFYPLYIVIEGYALLIV